MITRSNSLDNNFHNWYIVSQNKKGTENKFNYQSAIKHLEKNYLNPRSGIAFSGVNRIYNFYNKIIPIHKIKEFLSKDNSYTLHSKSFRKRYNPSFIRYKGQQIQADLIDVGNLNHKNNGVKFLLTLICSFTKKAWMAPIKNKKSDVVLIAFKKLFQNINKTPRSLLTDAGGEFVLVRKWCEKNNIKTYIPYSSFHGAYIERFNQTIKNRLYRWMDANKTENYIPHLDSLLHGYNNSTHSTIGISPNLAWNDKSTHPQIRERLQKYYNKFRKRKPRFKIGDVVRIKLLPKSSFSKGYDIQNNQELFKIHHILTNLPTPMYQIIGLKNPGDGIIKGNFYGYELVKTLNQ